MNFRRISRLLWFCCCFPYQLCFIGNPTDSKKIVENTLEELQDFQISQKTHEKYCDQFLPVKLNVEDDSFSHHEALEKSNIIADATYFDFTKFSNGGNNSHHTNKINSQWSQWESTQFSFFSLENENKLLGDFQKKYPRDLAQSRRSWLSLCLDFEKLNILNEKLKEFLTNTTDLDVENKFFVKSLDLIREEQKESYVKNLKDLIFFLFEEKKEFNGTIYLSLRKKYLAEFLIFLVDWRLFPPKLLKNLQWKLSSNAFLEWISQTIFEGVDPKFNINKNFQIYCILFHVEDYFENHYFLGYIKRFLNGLQDPQRNLVWLYVMKKSLMIKLADWSQTYSSQNYHQMDNFGKLVLSVFERAEIEILNQVNSSSHNSKNKNLPVKFIKLIYKLANFLSDPDFKENFLSKNSLDKYSELIIGSTHFMDYIHKVFFKYLSRENVTFSSELLLNFQFLKAESTLKLWSSTFFRLKHTLGLQGKYCEEKKNIYLKKMEENYQLNCRYLINEIQRNPQNKNLIQNNIFYKLENLYYISKRFTREPDGSYKISSSLDDELSTLKLEESPFF